MRTLVEIEVDIDNAMAVIDLDALSRLAKEVEQHTSPLSAALLESVTGVLEFRSANYESALHHFRRSLALHQEQGDLSAVARSRANIGNVYVETGRYSDALTEYDHAYAILKDLNVPSDVARITRNMGSLWALTGSYPKALEYYERAYAVSQEIGDVSGIASVTGNMSNVYDSTGDYARALEYGERALSMYTDLGDQTGIAMMNASIGMLYVRLEEFSTALEYLTTANTLYDELRDRSGLAFNTGAMALMYEGTGDLDRATFHYRRAADQHGEIGDKAGVLRNTSYLINIALLKGAFDEAERLLNDFEIEAVSDPGIQILYLAAWAQVLEHRTEFDAANQHLLQALERAHESGQRDLACEAHERIRDLAAKRRDIDDYIHHNQEYLRLTEEIRGKETQQRLAMQHAERNIRKELHIRDKERALLYGALPQEIVNRLVAGEPVSGDYHDNVALLFIDIVGSTSHGSRIDPTTLVSMLSEIFISFDEIIGRNGMLKIKTIGDAYMAAAFPKTGEQSSETSVEHRAAKAALEMIRSEFYWPREASLNDLPAGSLERLAFRIGLHSGPVVAGVIGKQRLQYDVWGDTVNVASRMESTGEPGRIQCSEAFVGSLTSFRDDARHPEERSDEGPLFRTTERGTIEVKGKGSMTTYWLEAAQ